jgi:hypothetical protein
MLCVLSGSRLDYELGELREGIADHLMLVDHGRD